MLAPTFFKDPDATLDYALDWSRVLPASDTIVTSSFIADAGITVVSEFISDGFPVVWLSGGTVNEKYAITNRITTDEGRIDGRTFFVRIKEL